jgi:protein subunit release factor B
MSKYGVTTSKEQQLHRRMEECSLNESDFDEQFIRSGGPGGQHVNRTATCVYLKHQPTGLEVKMQQARSQGLNRYYARKRMCELLEEKQEGTKSKAQLAQEKIRKQKAKRRKRSKKKTNTSDDGITSTDSTETCPPDSEKN